MDPLQPSRFPLRIRELITPSPLPYIKTPSVPSLRYPNSVLPKTENLDEECHPRSQQKNMRADNTDTCMESTCIIDGAGQKSSELLEERSELSDVSNLGDIGPFKG